MPLRRQIGHLATPPLADGDDRGASIFAACGFFFGGRLYRCSYVTIEEPGFRAIRVAAPALGAS
jgi:hypothetical protein